MAGTHAHGFIQLLIKFATDLLLPMMLLTYVSLLALRLLTYYTVKREEWFAAEFEKRLHKFLDAEDYQEPTSFYLTAKKLLEQTYYELFEVRGIMKRRKLDYITDPSDRLFLIQHGSAFLVKDTLKELKFLKYDGNRPQFLEISKNVLQRNPCFTRLFGIVPAGPLNDVLSILPGLFIVFGIFGTFLGIMAALPSLGDMDITNADSTKMVLDAFLLKVSFSMSTSVTGILLSVTSTIYNAILSPEKVFVDVVNRFDRSLDRLWNRCSDNILPPKVRDFDEHKDPVEALAELAIVKELTGKSNSEAGQVRRPLPPRPGRNVAGHDDGEDKKAS